MPIRNLDKIFHPQRIAVIGASSTPGAVGSVVFRNLISSGAETTIYPVNHKRESVQGIAAYPSIAEVPNQPDLAIICTPNCTVPALIQQCGEAGVRGVIVLSAGFREIGAEGRALERDVQQALRSFDGMRMIGPNCLGVIVPHVLMNASFAAAMPPTGRVAFVSQSGALCTSVLDWAIQRKIGFSHFISVGNALDVGISDLIEYLIDDPQTDSLILYVESIPASRPFISAARAFARKKPIVAYKAGRFEQSAKAAASHTGSMAGQDAVYEAAFERAGIVRIFDSNDMFDCAELLAKHNHSAGPRLAIVTNAGGPGVMATDELLDRSGTLAELSSETIEALNGCLPLFWSHGNPVDVLGDAPPQRYADAVDLVLKDPQADAVLVVLTPQAMTDPSETASAVAVAAAKSSKLVLAAWMGGPAVEAGRRRLEAAGIPSYDTPERAVNAFMSLVKRNRNQEILFETPRDLPVATPKDREAIRQEVREAVAQGEVILNETLSKKLLDCYHVDVTMPANAYSMEEAVEMAEEMGYPVVIKVLSPQITHKSDVGGVVLGLANADAVRSAFKKVTTSAREKRPDAEIQGVTVQPMVPKGSGQELIVGAKKDPVFGPVIMVGAGGTAAEIQRDRALAIPPLSEHLAWRMLKSLRIWPLLNGYRGKSPVNQDDLVRVLMQISYLIADFPEIGELDVNPLLVSPVRALALDARVVVDESAIQTPVREYGHLAIRPYPEKLIQTVTLTDQSEVRLRPICPQDEPFWQEVKQKAGLDSVRFRQLFSETDHEFAPQFRFIDYDRELAVVAETEVEGKPAFLGLGRLVFDADHDRAEFAFWVSEDWSELNEVLVSYCLEICQSWGIRQICCELLPDQREQLALLESREFAIEANDDESTLLRKDLQAPAVPTA